MNANTYLNRCFIVLFTLLIISCSSDDDTAPIDGGNNGGATTTSFFNLAPGNWWTYDVTQAPNVTQDSLYVNTSSVSGGNTVYTFGVSPQSSGLMSLLLSQSEVFEANQKLTASGTINIDFQGLTGLSFDIANAVIYDATASAGTELFSDSGSFTQNVQGFDLQFNYEISTIQGVLQPNVMVNGTDFQNVLQADMIINLEIVA
ncbi:MAG: hypothetical protein RQ756_01330, partial [Flavobacteriaceae bacterium]|nr:hypothetical protein [Flavobacteriaceae bacterium]